MGGHQKSNILKFLNVKECNGQERHLGNPFVFKRRRREEYKFLKEKVLKRIEGWKTKLLSLRVALLWDVLYKGGLSIAGKGDSIDIWRQPCIPWLEYGEFRDIMEQVKTRYPHMKSIADFSNDDGSWNTALVHDVFGVPLGEKICKIDRLPVEHNDILVWKEAGDELFTVKRGFQSIHPTQDNSDSSLWKLIWNQRTHFRHSTNIWRLVSGCFPTRDRLVFVADKVCPMCDVENETALHIFWECHCSQAIWFSSPFACFRGNTLPMATVKDKL
ncbi:hypothetical protein G4B88_013138 [Cannabis sativa]|uniref:Reverse transcriptase zinc-binding domain-containing protein n=1 Tax=Cannabis sativa TaxID=3483 RepID=A0A7J6I472_CANSA|nr:hypothetical protein G4B88_013138 [Cannabis sativa]